MANSLTTFRVGKMLRDYGSLIGRDAVLYKFCKPRLFEGKLQRHAPGKQLYRLQKLWRTYVQAAYQQEENELNVSIVELHRMLNCRPAFFRVAPSTSFTCKHRLCPFCYARQLGTHWRRLDAAAYRQQIGDDEGMTSSTGYTIVTRVVTLEIPESEMPVPAIPNLSSLMKVYVHKRRGWYRSTLARGGIMTTIAFPRENGWVFENRTLLLYEDKNLIPAKIREGATILDQPKRSELAKHLGKMWYYPTEFLLNDPQQVSAFLAIARGIRLVADYGCLRGQSVS